MYSSWFQKLMLVLLIIGGINWGIYGIWAFDAIGWLLGGSLGWIARTVFIIVGVAALLSLPCLFTGNEEKPEPNAP